MCWAALYLARGNPNLVDDVGRYHCGVGKRGCRWLEEALGRLRLAGGWTRGIEVWGRDGVGEALLFQTNWIYREGINPEHGRIGSCWDGAW
jgi:hypothetical protein